MWVDIQLVQANEIGILMFRLGVVMFHRQTVLIQRKIRSVIP